MKKNVYLIQPTYMNASVVHLPYAIGALASYAWKFQDICDSYDLKGIFFLRDKLSDIVEKLDNPFLIGFSNYIWNFEYNKKLAEEVKKAYPECIIVFGGPQISEDSGLFEECPFIDFLMYYEGEVPFRDLLRAYDGKLQLNEVSNIAYRLPDGSINTTEFKASEISDFPSPYESGFFDRIIEENPDIDFIPLIETNRGCPNKCAYCSWGKIKTRVRMFPLERVFADIEWVSKHNKEFLGFADANFGLFPRDEKIVDKIIECYHETGYPKKFQVSYSKETGDRVFNITKKLNEHGMDKGVTLSFQSMSKIVQENIGRSNMDVEYYKALLQKYSEAKIPTYTDLILGLPGETLESFKDGIDELLEHGQHTSLFVHLCEWLPLAEMGKKEYMEKHGIGFSKVPLNQPHRSSSDENDVQEFSRIITSTSTMDENEWKAMVMFSTCALCFHHLGLLQLIALYVHYEKGVKYSDFYSDLLSHLLNEENVGEAFIRVKKQTDDVIEKNESVVVFDDMFGDIAWPFEEYAFLKTVSKKDAFYENVEKFLEKYIEDEKLRKDLVRYQNFVVKDVNVSEKYFEGEYDWKNYFQSILVDDIHHELEKRNVRYSVKDERVTHSWPEYAEKVLWFGRRGGKNIYTSEITEEKI